MLKPIGKPMSVGLGPLDIESIERAVKPTEAQRAAFDELKAISAKTEEMVRTSCAGEPPLTPSARLDTVEARLAAMLAAVRMLRPAVDAVYKTPSDEQKARFDGVGPGEGHGSRCRHHDRQ